MDGSRKLGYATGHLPRKARVSGVGLVLAQRSVGTLVDEPVLLRDIVANHGYDATAFKRIFNPD